jgi:hypothetical protein
MGGGAGMGCPGALVAVFSVIVRRRLDDLAA